MCCKCQLFGSSTISWQSISLQKKGKNLTKVTVTTSVAKGKIHINQSFYDFTFETNIGNRVNGCITDLLSPDILNIFKAHCDSIFFLLRSKKLHTANFDLSNFLLAYGFRVFACYWLYISHVLKRINVQVERKVFANLA